MRLDFRVPCSLATLPRLTSLAYVSCHILLCKLQPSGWKVVFLPCQLSKVGGLTPCTTLPLRRSFSVVQGTECNKVALLMDTVPFLTASIAESIETSLHCLRLVLWRCDLEGSFAGADLDCFFIVLAILGLQQWLKGNKFSQIAIAMNNS